MIRLLTGVRAKLLIVVLLALGPAVALLFVYAASQNATAQQRARADAERLVEADSRSIQDLLRQARATLVAFSDTRPVQERDWRTAEAAARRIKAAQADYLNVGVVSAEGSLVVSALPATGSVDARDRSYYQRAMRYRTFSIGDYQVGKVSRRPSFTVSYPVIGKGGSVASVSYVSFDVETFRRRLSPAGLPRSATEYLLDSVGQIILRDPPTAGAEGKPYPDPALIRTIQEQGSGWTTVRAADGASREVRFEPVRVEPDGGLYLMLELAPEQLFREQRRQLGLTVAGFGLAAAVAAAAAWGLSTLWIYWPTRRLESAAVRIGRGDLRARARLRPRRDELGNLGREFDAMAEVLERDVAELQRTRGTLASLNLELEQRVKERTDELAIASRIAGTLQQSLLSLPQRMERAEIGHFYGSATEHARVGGDFYDIFALSGPIVAVAIGDVSGKGLQAASLTALVKNALRAHAVEGDFPDEAMRKTNEVVRRFTAEDTFVTVFFGLIDTETGVLSYANAGHPPPYVVDADGVEPLAERGPLIGAFRGLSYPSSSVRLRQGQMLVLYTDGIIEARAPDGEFFGEERFLSLLRSLEGEDPAALAQHVHQRLLEFGAGRLTDDVAFLVVRPYLTT